MLPYPLPKSGILCSAGARKMGISTPKIEWSHLAAGFGSLLDNCFKTVKVGDVRASLDRDSAILNNGDPVMLSTPELSISGQKLTPEQFLALPEGDIVYELVDGRAVSKNEPMSPNASMLVSNRCCGEFWRTGALALSVPSLGQHILSGQLF
jgi:hypothetical protein